MKTKLYKILLFFAVILSSIAAYGQYQLLFVRDATSSDAEADNALITYLTGELYSITPVEAATFSSNYGIADAYNGYDAVFISETVGSGDVVAFATAGFPVPCVTTEGYAVRTNRWAFITNDDTEFHQSGSTERTDGVKTLIINNGENYITSFYGENTEVAWTTAAIDNLGVTGCKLDQTMEGAIKLATYNDPVMADFPTLWAIPKDSKVISTNTIIPVNIVIFGAIAPGMGAGATPAFNNIIKRSLKWVTGNYSATDDFNVSQLYGISIMPNPAQGIINVSFMLKASGSVRLNIYDITGKIMETIESGYLNAGQNTIMLDFSDKPNAQYIINIITEKDVLTGIICKN